MQQIGTRTCVIMALLLALYAFPALAQPVDGADFEPSPEALSLLEAALDPVGSLETSSCDDVLPALGRAAAENPESVADMVFFAIQACPELAEDLIAAAVEAAPEQAEAIFTAALAADPAAAGAASAALTRVLQLPNFPQAALRAPVFRDLPSPSPILP